MKPNTPPTTLLGLAVVALLGLLLATKTTHTSLPPPAVVAEKPGRDSPIRAIHAHVCGFHFYSGDMKRALRVDHYCSHLNDEVLQCVIYDSDKKNARLIGIEYIISETLFTTLPEEEKKLWHSHRYEVMSGLLTAPGLADGAERELMQGLVNTYGKTWHLWQVDRGDELPFGLPRLMMGFTADGQAGPGMVAERDRELKIDTARIKAQRADLTARPVAAGADAWLRSPGFQISDELPRSAPDTPKP